MFKSDKRKVVESAIKKIILERIKKSSINEQYSESDIKFVNGKAVIKKGNKILAKIYDKVKYYQASGMDKFANSVDPKYPYNLEIPNVGTKACESLDVVVQMLNKYIPIMQMLNKYPSLD